jgi:hypothetical protein
MSDPVPINSEDEMMDVDDYSGSSEDEQDLASGRQVLRMTGVTARKGGWVYRQPAVQLINFSDHTTFQVSHGTDHISRQQNRATVPMFGADISGFVRTA